MKKLFVGAILVGLAVGAYFIFNDRKKEDISSQSQEDNSPHKPKAEETIVADKPDGIKEMYEAKDNSAQAVHERHTEAASIMADAFKNVEPIENDEEPVTPIIDTKDIETIQELYSLSDELDELLK